ncbi:MAG: hypothetical protein QN163_08100 [Armatimonadota bacterium]|nr:hypothetical protein [Armatimonadota bacterium]MDR5697664.1 hypothetical protein [Armatimonadota bacterium]
MLNVSRAQTYNEAMRAGVGVFLVRTVGLFLAAVLAAAPAPVFAQPTPRVVAVADFWDASTGGFHIGAERLSERLARELASRSPAIQVVPSSEVRTAMRARGYRPADLYSPARASELAQTVGAHWIVTGRWTHLDIQEIEVRASESAIPPPPRRVIGQAVLEIRVLDASSRRVLLEETFWAASDGWHGLDALWDAAERVLALAADRIARM